MCPLLVAIYTELRGNVQPDGGDVAAAIWDSEWDQGPGTGPGHGVGIRRDKSSRLEEAAVVWAALQAR